MVGPNYQRPAAPTPPAYKEAEGWTPAQPVRRRRPRRLVDGVRRPDAQQPGAAGRGLQPEPGRRRGRLPPGPRPGRRAARGAVSRPSAVNGSATSPASGGGSVDRDGDRRPAAARGTGQRLQHRRWAAPGRRTSGAKVRRAIENAKANAQASAADLANARLSAQMELAADYIALRQLDEQKRLLDADRSHAYARVADDHPEQVPGRQRRQERRAAAPRASSTTPRRSDIDLGQQRAAHEHAIAVLTGEPPAELTIAGRDLELEACRRSRRRCPRPCSSVGPTSPPPSARPRPPAPRSASQVAGLLSDPHPHRRRRLRRRNDRQSVQRRQTLRLVAGRAGAPRPSSTAASPAPRSQAARAAYDQAVANYRQTVLTAFEPGGGQPRRPAGAGARRAAAARRRPTPPTRTLRIAQNQYKAGTVDYTTVVIAQATALGADRRLLQHPGQPADHRRRPDRRPGRRLDHRRPAQEALAGLPGPSVATAPP